MIPNGRVLRPGRAPVTPRGGWRPAGAPVPAPAPPDIALAALVADKGRAGLTTLLP